MCYLLLKNKQKGCDLPDVMVLPAKGFLYKPLHLDGLYTFGP